jgi:exo-beta-1,3-glucanase (GH17 family)
MPDVAVAEPAIWAVAAKRSYKWYVATRYLAASIPRIRETITKNINITETKWASPGRKARQSQSAEQNQRGAQIPAVFRLHRYSPLEFLCFFVLSRHDNF